MSTVSHGFVFCAQQPEGCQGLRSGILQQLFVSPGKAMNMHWDFLFFPPGSFYHLMSTDFACQKAMILS